MRMGTPVAAAVLSGSDTTQAEGHETSAVSLEAMVSKLAMRLQRAPDDPDGWAMLARSYTVLERNDDALAAWRRALALTPHDPQLLADYADALASANNGDLGGEAKQSIRAALAIDPDQPKALALAASAAFDERDYPQAIRLWQRLEKVSAPGSEVADQMRKNIDETRRLISSADLQAAVDATSGAALPARATTQPNASAAGVALQVDVRLSPDISRRANPADYVFVYAHAVNGPSMPLAVQRLRASQLPATVRLDDSMAMASGLKLSDFERVTVEARVSASGDARTKRGDLIGHSGPVQSGVDQVATVVIRDVVP
jgi:cytochrome c-type biogenesis protein CcmH